MTVSEKVAYIKGLAENAGFSDNDAKDKVVKAIIDVLEDIAGSIGEINEQLDAVDEDLATLEEDFYEDDEDYDDEDDYYEDDWFVPIGLTFFEGGTMDYTIVTGSYKVEKDKVICNVYGEDIIFHIVGEYLVRYDEAPITGYIIAEDTDPDIIYENKLDGKNRTYKHAKYFSKVN